MLTRLLENSNNLQIQNLSILADLCLSTEARNKVRETKLASHILFLLKNVKLSANLQCRACRLIGNLLDCSWHAKNFYKSGVVEVLENI